MKFAKGLQLRAAQISTSRWASAEQINAILHDHGEFIIGRMGIPYRKRGISIISIALDAPQDTISALSGKIGKLNGVSVKTAYSGVIAKD